MRNPTLATHFEIHKPGILRNLRPNKIYNPGVNVIFGSISEEAHRSTHQT